MPYSTAEFAQSVRDLAAKGDLDEAFSCIIELVLHVGVRDGAIGRVFSSPLLDQLCGELGREIRMPAEGSEVDEDHSVIVATSVSKTGGHSRVIRDLLEADTARRKTLLLTGVKIGQPPADTLLFQGDPTIEVEIAPGLANYAGRFTWLMSRLRELAPATIYLVVHPFDAVAIAAAAAQPNVARRIFYYHNSDHSLALGVHLPQAIHVDYHRKGFDRCEAAGVVDQAFWPLTVHVPPMHPGKAESVRRQFTTCCCGGFEKFETPHMAESFPYAIAYEDMVLEVLQTTGGKHLHIGEISDELRRRIAARLDGAGIDVARFQYVPFAPQLGSALNRFEVDAYLGSMPRGGGRATVEAMGCGLPIIIHSNYRSKFLSDENEVYPEAFVWRTLDELRNALKSLDAATLKHHSVLSRRHFEAHHRPALLRTAIRETIAGKRPLPPPTGARYPTDELQAFFDERHGYETFSSTFAERRGPWTATYDPVGELIEPAAPAADEGTDFIAPLIDKGGDADESLEELLADKAERRRRAYVMKLAEARAKVRQNSPRVKSADQAFVPGAFVKLVAQRFDSGLGSDASFGTRSYINYIERPEGVTVRDTGRVNAREREQLFLADVMKVQGFFGDAEDIYREVAEAPTAQAPALRGLGDLLLTLATWSEEFNSYAWDGRALNPYAKLGSFKGRKTWHSAQLKEALNVLERAVKAEPDHPDGLWLLAIAQLKIGNWQQGEKLARRYAEEMPDAADANALIVRASFGLNERKSLNRARNMFAGWRDPLGRRWMVKSVDVTRAEDLPREKSSYVEVHPPVIQKIDSKFVKNGQIMHFDQPLPFERSYVAEHRAATVLPLFGMLLANDSNLVPESLHHRECHFDIFTAAVRSLHDDRALLIMPEPDEVDLSAAIFIGSNNNYYHWLIDELPRLCVLESSGLDDGRPILIDKNAGKWQLELLARFGIPDNRLAKVDFNRPQRVHDLLAPSHLSTLMVAHPFAVEYVREKLLKSGRDASAKRGKRLYVARSAGTVVAGRSIINGDEVWEKFRKAGFKRVDPGTLTIKEQIKLFRDVEIIAGPGGAGLTNAVLAPQGAKILNLTSSDIACQTFTSIAAAVGQESWFCGGASIARPYPRWIWTNFDYLVDLKDVDVCIAALTS